MKSQDKRPDNCISVSEAAQRLGVCVETVRRWIKSGKIKARKVGIRYFIPLSEIEERVSTPSGRVSGGISGQISEQSAKDEIIAALREQNRVLQERIRELEADKAYLQERILTLERLLESMAPKALPKPPLRERIKRLFKRAK